MAVPPKAVEIYISYSTKDKELKNELEKHLAKLEEEGLITLWSDRQMIPGSKWQQELQAHINTARMILLLVTPDYLESEWATSEMRRALELRNAQQTHVIPIILRPAGWMNSPIGNFQALPSHGRPVTEWSDHNEAYL